MEENFVVEIHSLGIKKTKTIIDQYNRALTDLRLTLQANYGTSNINSVISIAIASTALNLGIRVAEAIMTIGASEISTTITNAEPIADWGDWAGVTDYDMLPRNFEELRAHIEHDPMEQGTWNAFWGLIEDENNIYVKFQELVEAKSYATEVLRKARELSGNGD